MLDDIRVCIQVKHKEFQERSLSPDGNSRPKRLKKWGIGNQGVRVNSVKKSRFLVIEGSFNGYLNGQTIVGSLDLLTLVRRVVAKVLKQLGIMPTAKEQRRIDQGRVKLERLDLVGYLYVKHLGGPAAVLHALDVGLAGSKRNRMVFPKETIVYHACSSFWSLMAYDKAQHLRSTQPQLWKSLDPLIKDVARHYLRFELRQFRRELLAQGWAEVRDVDMAELTSLFSSRLRALLSDVRRPYPKLQIDVKKPSVGLLLGLLAALGVDLISLRHERTRRRIRQELAGLGIDARQDSEIPRKYRRTLAALLDEPAFPIRHGAPPAIRAAKLLRVA